MIKPIDFKALEMVRYAVAKWLDVEVQQLDMDFLFDALRREQLEVCDWEGLEDWLADEADKNIDEMIEQVDYNTSSIGNTKVSRFLNISVMRTALVNELRARLELDFTEVYVEASGYREYLDGQYFINTSLLKEFRITKRDFLLDKGDIDETV